MPIAGSSRRLAFGVAGQPCDVRAKEDGSMYTEPKHTASCLAFHPPGRWIRPPLHYTKPDSSIKRTVVVRLRFMSGALFKLRQSAARQVAHERPLSSCQSPRRHAFHYYQHTRKRWGFVKTGFAWRGRRSTGINPWVQIFQSPSASEVPCGIPRWRSGSDVPGGPSNVCRLVSCEN